MDEAKRHGIEVDPRRLAKDLGIPVVAAAARSEEGIPELLKYIYDVATGTYVCRPHRLERTAPRLEKAIAELTAKITAEFPDLPNARWIALRLLEGDQKIIDAVKSGELKALSRNTPVRSIETAEQMSSI
jgi:ferrous iron transport protein B